MVKTVGRSSKGRKRKTLSNTSLDSDDAVEVDSEKRDDGVKKKRRKVERGRTTEM